MEYGRLMSCPIEENPGVCNIPERLDQARVWAMSTQIGK